MKKESKHTPGQWAWVRDESGARVFANDGNVALIALAGDRSEQAANAALIAAAPDLFEVALAAERNHVFHNKTDFELAQIRDVFSSPENTRLAMDLIRIRAAIARAQFQLKIQNADPDAFRQYVLKQS